MKALSSRTETVTNSPIRKMFNRSLGMTDVISFTVGEPDFSTPAHIVDAAVKALRGGEHHYTPNAGILPLRQAIGGAIEKSHGLRYDPETEIIATAGGMEALYLAMLVLLDPGDEMILTDPCWTNYSRQVLLCGGKPRFVRVTRESSFQYEPAALEASVTPRTKGLILNSPANPTGGIAGREAIARIAEIAKKHDLYVVSDEVYARLLYENNAAPSIACLPGMRERTLIVNSFSKTYAMTGWRVGFAAGPAQIVKNMTKFQENVAACVNSAAQFGAIAALEGTQEPLHRMQRAYAARRSLILEGFSHIEGLSCFAPQGAFYALVDIGKTGMKAEQFAAELLEKERVIVVPGEAFGAGSDHYIRLSFATSEENIREGVARIKRFMDCRKQTMDSRKQTSCLPA